MGGIDAAASEASVGCVLDWFRSIPRVPGRQGSTDCRLPRRKVALSLAFSLFATLAIPHSTLLGHSATLETPLFSYVYYIYFRTFITPGVGHHFRLAQTSFCAL